MIQIKMIKLNKATPFLLSAFWIILALWIELAPRTLGFITDSLNYAFKRLDYLSYDTKMRTLNQGKSMKSMGSDSIDLVIHSL